MKDERLRRAVDGWGLKVQSSGSDFSAKALEAAHVEASRAFRAGHSLDAAFQLGRAAFYQALHLHGDLHSAPAT